MTNLSGPLLTDGLWPAPLDDEAAAEGRARWLEAASRTPELTAFAETLLADPAGRAMTDTVFAHSPFLLESMAREPAFVHRLVTEPPDLLVDSILAELVDEAGALTNEAAIKKALRFAKRRVALTVALADIGGVWPLELVTGALSRLAETALSLTADYLIGHAAEAGYLASPESAESGLIVLGMGKLGAGELNYSSDIDLIILFDEDRVQTTRPDDLPRTMIRIARDLARIMEERTVDGYVFRTDLRLRPDHGATPLAISAAAAEGYYGSLAQTWERAAMIKARPVAGDREAGYAFLNALSPFIWRRSLDFSALEDIHRIRRRLRDKGRSDRSALEGRDVKLGPGGIREIEFLVQARQMLFGGRDPRLRLRGTLETLDALVETGRMDRETSEDLGKAYRVLRRVEHRLQMIEDRQTHALPDTAEELDAVAAFMGESPETFRAKLRQATDRVEHAYAAIFEFHPPDDGLPALSFSGTDPQPETEEALASMGFQKPPEAVECVRGWRHGRYRSTRSERARARLQDLLPILLTAIGRTPDPDVTLKRFDAFLAGLPTGVQLFNLFYANPSLLDLMAEMLGTSERLASHLTRRPDQLEAVITPGFFDAPPTRESLAAELARLLSTAGEYEGVLDAVRRWTNDHRFRASAHLLRGITPGDRLAPYLTAIAELGLDALQSATQAEFARRHGRVPGGGLAVLALGKLGSGEMSIRSDLDLIMIFDAEEDAVSDGEKSLGAGQYYTRLIQRLTTAIVAPTAEGALYEVDMRLRPSGHAGPLATSLAAFRRYHAESAWTWEHMALTRARPISGAPDMMAAVAEAVHETLTRPRDPAVLLREVASMRRRIAKQFPPAGPWAVKHAQGGIVEIEFIAQTLQLRHAAEAPGVLASGTGEALERLASHGFLAPDDAALLKDALAMNQRIQAYLRLTHQGRLDPAAASPGLRAGLARASFPDEAYGDDLEAAGAKVEEIQNAARALYLRLIEEPAGLDPEDTSDSAAK